MHAQNDVCDDKFGDSNTIQQLVHGNHRVYWYPLYYRSNFVDRKYHAFASYWEENYLHCVGVLNVDWCSLEYARLFDI